MPVFALKDRCGPCHSGNGLNDAKGPAQVALVPLGRARASGWDLSGT